MVVHRVSSNMGTIKLHDICAPRNLALSLFTNASVNVNLKIFCKKGGRGIQTQNILKESAPRGWMHINRCIRVPSVNTWVTINNSDQHSFSTVLGIRGKFVEFHLEHSRPGIGWGFCKIWFWLGKNHWKIQWWNKKNYNYPIGKIKAVQNLVP